MVGTSMSRWVSSQWAILAGTSRAQWWLFVSGVALMAFGVGAGILPSGLGAGTARAIPMGLTDLTALSLGVWVVIISFVLLLLTRLLGTAVTLGTILLTVFFGVLIDVAFAVAPHVSTLPAQSVQWFVGAVTLAFGAGFTINSGVGTNEYSVATVAVSNRLGGRLWLGRIVLDGSTVAIALAVGGPIGWGTVGLMVVFPLVLPAVVRATAPLARRHPAHTIGG